MHLALPDIKNMQYTPELTDGSCNYPSLNTPLYSSHHPHYPNLLTNVSLKRNTYKIYTLISLENFGYC